MYQMSTQTALILLFCFYGLTFLVSLTLARKEENVDGYMVSNNSIGFGMAAASMTATWIWAASFYAAATSGYKYGLSGALHYGFWGALMIFFIYPFGKRFRQVAPKAHTLAEIMHARHGRSSQMIMAGSNIVGSLISLTVNFTAAGALLEILSPLSFIHGVVIAGVGVLSYTIWSGFRSSVTTDFGQVVAMIFAAVVIIPIIFFQLGGSELFDKGMLNISAEQSSFYSQTAILEQGAPYFVAVLAYAIGNQTIAQRLFAVREDLLKPTFITATIGYASIVIGLGMLGFLALLAGIVPQDGVYNNLIPQMAATYLSPFFVGLFFIMVIGSLSSTADSDLSALSALVMTDVYGKHLSKGKVDPKTMLFVGRVTMVTATFTAVMLACLKFDILTMLVFVGALWGAIVFPVIASLYWSRVNNIAFTGAAIAGFGAFLVTRFQLIEFEGLFALLFEIIASVGGGVVIGLMTFGFFGLRAACVVGGAAFLIITPFTLDGLRDYPVLLSSMTAYGASTLVCVICSLKSQTHFDFNRINSSVVSFNDPSEQETKVNEVPQCQV
ncbi:sodium:solute symporter family protein [Vibrio caribbeanicus]|uniref:sodium:solute symporter family protein n=1 Tax=Vibrio caribbeanicus TaxID=701175 RepID=UPI002284734A|nr:sodium:solute symporter family protein [Vibrio caribbeanicus]MCY9843114.1 sodium:solute symporter family protein [Vibrio caribbeanicus]